MVNKGTITIDGHDSDAPALNVGMLANNSSGMKNSGIINVNGLNSTGLQVINAGQLNSDGTINVGGKGISSGFRNYGAWVEGAGSNVNVSGKISLAGTGAVGFAKDGGSLTLSGNGAVLFGSSDQIGFMSMERTLPFIIPEAVLWMCPLKTQHYSVLPVVRHSRELQMLLLHLRRLVRTLMHLLPRGNRMAVWPRQ